MYSHTNQFVMQLRPHQSRALDAMNQHKLGQIIVPTGGGKTLIMIMNLLQRFVQNPGQVAVVVAPRILLAEQLSAEFLEFITSANVMHVHSGETHHYSSTKCDKIANWVADHAGTNRIIFTTYHSLGRVVDAGVCADVAYFDEAHNSTQKSHFVATAATSMGADSAYFFTATPKHHTNPNANGMNNVAIYGKIIETVRAQELIDGGCIIPPQVDTYKVDITRDKRTAAEADRNMIVDILDSIEGGCAKVLVAAPSTKVMWNMLANSDILIELEERGYDVLHITSKHGAYVNRTKVNREKFFDTLTEWGKDPERKFVLLHYSILSEGINVPGLTHCIMLRQMPIIEMAQTVGRVIRMDKDDAADIAAGRIPAGSCHLYRKQFGKVIVPVFTNYGSAIAKRLQGVVDTIFVQGLPAISTMTR
ncbi:DNA helicase [Synechococcus phage S-CREM1]|nr:DNA helicase [Synechococcus phage S-CREM1]